MKGRPEIRLNEEQLTGTDWRQPNARVAVALKVSLSTAIKLRRRYNVPPVKRGRPFGSKKSI